MKEDPFTFTPDPIPPDADWTPPAGTKGFKAGQEFAFDGARYQIAGEMSDALDAAADWWAGELMSPKYRSPASPEIAAKFRAKMRETLPAYIERAKKDPAWHVWTNGAVIIGVDYSPCPYLLEVCEACGIEIFRGLESSGMFSSKLTMWIERDRVIVMVGCGERRVIWLR